MNPNGFQEMFYTLSVAKGDISISCFAAGHGDRGGGILQRGVGRVTLLLQKRDQIPRQNGLREKMAAELGCPKEFLEPCEWSVIRRAYWNAKWPQVKGGLTNSVVKSKRLDEFSSTSGSRHLFPTRCAGSS